jgi:drug/metabolite transporter (DMT)-like permease
VVTATGWGFNWPVLKVILREIPPLTLRGASGLAAAAVLLACALAMRQRLRVPASEWPPLLAATLLNITLWTGLSTAGLVWLSGGEGAVVSCSMPVWAALLAWPVLGEKPTPLRLLALALGLGGIVILMAGQGLQGGVEKLPGVLMLLVGCLCFALGAVLSKKRPLRMAPAAALVWQFGLGSLPILLVALPLESTAWSQVSTRSWLGVVYLSCIALSLSYLTWFAALRRLPANTAAMGTLLTPVIGMVASAHWLGEPLGTVQFLALGMTLGGVVLAMRR